MGDFKWVQNIEAVNWILDEIWPQIQSLTTGCSSLANLRLWIVGKNIPEDIKAKKSKTILIDENAPDNTEKIYQKSFILLAPLRVGGGTSYKILESMASGVPVVTTELGVVGLGAKNQKEALVGENPEDLAKNVLKLLEDKEIYERITKEARNLIEEKFTWENITKVLESVYKQAIAE